MTFSEAFQLSMLVLVGYLTLWQLIHSAIQIIKGNGNTFIWTAFVMVFASLSGVMTFFVAMPG